MAIARSPRRLIVMNFLLVFLLGLFVARLPSTLAQISGGRADGLASIAEVQRMVERGYVDKPDAQKLTKGAIDGLLESLDDPYAEYVPADEAAEFEKQMTGSFSGIGCQIDIKDQWLVVVSPLEDSPAFNAGIIAGDRIVKVNDQSTHGKTTDQCIKMITGPEGTAVHLDVLRNGQELIFDLKRAKIVSKSARGFRRIDNGSGHWDYLIDPATKTAYIRLSQFTPTAPEELVEALHDAETAAGGPLGGLILDLRYNPGGLMEGAIEIVNMFNDQGRIMSTRGRNTPEEVYNAEPRANVAKYPIAILVNGNSASASEIVSGSLSTNLEKSGRVVVIGTRTFGKGLVQSVTGLRTDPRAIVKFTTAHYYLPDGKLIQRTDDATDWGVDPTSGFFLPMSDTETIAYLLRRRDWDVLRKPGTELPPGVEPVPAIADQHWADPSWIENSAKDKQLAGALKTMQAKITTGGWAKLSDEKEQHGHILMTEMKKLEHDSKLLSKQLILNEKRMEKLETLAATGKGDTKLPDLWDDKLDLTGGLVEVKDKDGKVIADLKITGRDLERWLAISDIESPNKSESADPSARGHVKDQSNNTTNTFGGTGPFLKPVEPKDGSYVKPPEPKK